jgi:hypothetical protein
VIWKKEEFVELILAEILRPQKARAQDDKFRDGVKGGWLGGVGRRSMAGGKVCGGGRGVRSGCSRPLKGVPEEEFLRAVRP